MVNVNLKFYKIKKLDVMNDMKQPRAMKVKQDFDFNCYYSADGKTAYAALTETLEMMENPDDFHIRLVLEGVFDVSGDGEIGQDDKKQAHVLCYDTLFPYAAQMISQIGMNTGVHILLKKVPMDASFVGFSKMGEGAASDSEKMIDFPSEDNG